MTAASLALLALLGPAQLFSSPPLDDLGPATFLSRPGHLYEHLGARSNCVPTAHAGALQAAADSIAPVNGRVVLLSVGASLTEQIFASFERQVDAGVVNGAAVPQVHPQLVLVNGGQGGESANVPLPGSVYWSRVDTRLAALGLTPDQVRIVWISVGHKCEPGPATWDCSEVLRENLRTTLQFLKAQKFPNLELCYLSSRIYAGYAGPNGEPFAYMEGWGVREVIREQSECAPGAGLCLAQDDVPAVLWGPYLWASGPEPRTGEPACASSAIGAGLTWQSSDFEVDGLHPSPAGEVKAAARMYAFFRADPYVGKWFAPDCSFGRRAVVEASADAYVDEGAPSVNFGDADELAWERAPGADKLAFVQFDLSSLGLDAGDVDYAKLSLRNPDWVSSNEHQFLGLTVTESADGWAEDQITWDNRPPLLGAASGWASGASRDGSRGADVTDVVRAALAAGEDGVFSLELALPMFGDTRSRSREAGDGPRLVLSISPAGWSESYCTAGTSASGCRATLSAAGVARACSPIPFTLRADDVEGGKGGLLFLGAAGRKSATWGNCSSFRCVAPPFRRTAQQSAGGTPGACDGSLSLDFNTWSCGNPGGAPQPGMLVQVQAWYRDPLNTCNRSTSFSDALEFLVCP